MLDEDEQCLLKILLRQRFLLIYERHTALLLSLENKNMIEIRTIDGQYLPPFRVDFTDVGLVYAKLLLSDPC